MRPRSVVLVKLQDEFDAISSIIRLYADGIEKEGEPVEPRTCRANSLQATEVLIAARFKEGAKVDKVDKGSG